MDPELKRKKRWFRALQIAECLFDDEGYHTKYLEDLKEFLKGEESVQSKNKRGSYSEIVSKSESRWYTNDKVGRSNSKGRFKG